MKLAKNGTNKGLLDAIEYNGRTYITSHRLHEDVRPSSGLSETNRSIRSSKTYDELVSNRHIIDLEHKDKLVLGNADFASLIKSNSYRPVMLIDPVAQKAIEHHFKKTAPQAVRSSQENAALGLAGINLELISKDQNFMALLRSISTSMEAKEQAELALQKTQQIEEKLDDVNERISRMDGDSKYETVLAFSRKRNLNIPMNISNEMGRKAVKACKESGFPIGKVPDERFGKVNSYPSFILEDIFQDIA